MHRQGEPIPFAGLGSLDDSAYWASTVEDGRLVFVNSDEEVRQGAAACRVLLEGRCVSCFVQGLVPRG